MPRDFSRYRALADHLAIRPERAITRTFAEVEAILGRPLSATARTSRSWWIDRGLAHVRLWDARGWRARLDWRDACVHFTRDAKEGAMPRGDWGRPRPSKFQPLVDYLVERRDANEIVLGLGQIAAIVGAPLSETMHVDSGVWNGVRLAYVRAWEAVGWTATLDRRNRCVHFIRNAEG